MLPYLTQARSENRQILLGLTGPFLVIELEDILNFIGRVSFCIFSTLALAGCGINQTVRDEQAPIIVKDAGLMKHPDKQGSVYGWMPHSSAMIIDGEGNRCVRVAAGARVTGGSTQLSLSADTVKQLGNTTADLSNAIQQAFQRINAPSELANILDVVLFHHCIQDQNGTFSDLRAGGKSKGEATMELYKSVIDVIKTAYTGQLKPGGGGADDKGVSAGTGSVTHTGGARDKSSSEKKEEAAGNN